MSTIEIKRRKPWLAGLLNLVTPGAGHLYSGRPARGLVLFAALQCLALALIGMIIALPIGYWVLLILPVGILTAIFTTIDAVKCAKAAPAEYRLARYNRWYIYLLFFLVPYAAREVATYELRLHVIQAFRIPTESMEPSVLVGDYLLVSKLAYRSSAPQRGDLAAYLMQDPSKSALKRIVGLPGDTIEIRQKHVLINGNALEEPYVHFLRAFSDGAFTPELDTMAPTLLPPGKYFVLGDNRDNSLDSRLTGPVAREKIIGKATSIYFSWDSEDGRVRWDRIGKVLQ